MERRWLRESVPALGGRTPIEAGADPTRREELERLLASFPEPTDRPAMTLRPSRLRALLGLAETRARGESGRPDSRSERLEIAPLVGFVEWPIVVQPVCGSGLFGAVDCEKLRKRIVEWRAVPCHATKVALQRHGQVVAMRGRVRA